MSKNLFFCIIMFFACTKSNNNQVKTSILFNQKVHDFSKISTDKPSEYKFVFYNSGKAPLTLNDVKPSCGCTAAEWTKNPILHGDSGYIKVNFHVTFSEVFNKEIKVFYNGADSPVTLNIKGEVQINDSIKNKSEI